MVVIRLSRQGTKHRPKYRIMVADQRFWVKGRFLEMLGYFNPAPRGQEVGLDLNLEKAQEWIKKGAQPTQRVKSLIKMAESSKK